MGDRIRAGSVVISAGICAAAVEIAVAMCSGDLYAGGMSEYDLK